MQAKYFYFVIIVSWLLPGITMASSQDLLDDMFDTYVNTTPADKYETQRRGGYTFGSVVARNRIVQPNLIAFDPPSFRGGCQGIDLYGGSFSFINKDQLNQALRAIASNALSYAFTLALEGVCPTCMQKMEKLRDWVNQVNKEMKDSCRFGQMMVNATGLDQWHSSRVQSARAREESAGTVDDSFDFSFNFTSELTSDNAVGTMTSVNAVWAAMAASDTASWFGSFGDNELREVLMSVTGTLIKSPLDETNTQCLNTAGDQEYCLRELPPILTVEHFINGDDSGAVQIYECQDGYVDCLNPVPVAKNWQGLKFRVREVLFGPAPTFTGGLVFKIRNKTAVLDTTEERFIESAPIPVYTILKSVAKYPGTVLTIGEQLQEIIAGQMARNVVFEMISSVRQSFGLNNIQMSQQMRDRLKDRVAEFESRQSVEHKELDNTYKLMQLVAQISQQISQQDEMTDSQVLPNRSRK